MKKKLLSLALALAVCLSLMVPALAENAALDSEGEAAITVDYAGSDVLGDITLYKGNMFNEYGEEEIIGGYNLIPSGQSITITNTGDNASAYLYVYYQQYNLYTSSEPVYGVDIQGKYYGGFMYYYLTPNAPSAYEEELSAGNGLYWRGMEYLDDYELKRAVQLHSGEKATITLPDSGEDSIYMLYVTCYFPDENYSVWKIFPMKYGDAPAVTTTPTAPANPAATSAFTDVPASEYYAEPVSWAIEEGITNGTSANKFSPEETCSNAQILTFLWRACGEPEPAIGNPYSNVAESDYYYKAARWAYEKGMVSSTTFDADKPCTRAMTVTYIWQASGSPAAASAVSFTDVPASASYAAAVAWAVNQGITNGDGANTFSPDKTCTRGQIVTFLYRAFA